MEVSGNDINIFFKADSIIKIDKIRAMIRANIHSLLCMVNLVSWKSKNVSRLQLDHPCAIYSLSPLLSLSNLSFSFLPLSLSLPHLLRVLHGNRRIYSKHS